MSRPTSNLPAACYTEAFEDLAGRDPARAARVGTVMCVLLGVLLGRLDEARSRTAAVIAQARAAGNPVVLREALATDGFLAAMAGEAGAGDRLREAVRLPGFTDTPFPYEAPETILAMWYLWRGELDPARDLLNAVIAVAERHGSDESADHARVHLMEVEWRAGNWDAAAAHAAADARWSRETGYPQQGVAAYAVSLVEAGRGNIDHARELAATGVEQAEAERDWTFAAQCRWVLGLLELSADDPAAALRWLEPVADMLQAGGIGEPGRYPFTPDLIEAWAATGQLDRAASRLAWLQDAARRLDHPWARITSGRAEAALLLAQRDPAAAVAAVAAVIPEARAAGAAVRARPLPAGPGHRAAQGPPAPRRRRLPRRGHRHLRRPGRPAVAGAGRGAAGPARARTRPRPDRRPSGASPTWWPPGRPTRRSPPPCTSASRPSRPTSPASTASSACAAGSTWPAAAPAKPPTRTVPGCRAAATPAIAPLGETRADAHPGRLQRRDPHGEGIPRCQHGAGPRSLGGGWTPPHHLRSSNGPQIAGRMREGPHARAHHLPSLQGCIGARPRPGKRHSIAGFTEERAAPYGASFW